MRQLMEHEPGDEVGDALAEEVGIEYGRAMALAMGDVGDVQRSFRTSLHVVADALTALTPPSPARSRTTSPP